MRNLLMNSLAIVALLLMSISMSAQDKPVMKAEQMPVFGSCAEGDDKCSNKKLVEYISQELTYPEQAKKNNTTGRVMVGFVVDKNGLVKDAEILRDLKDGCGKEALRVVNAMNELPQKWHAGVQDGKKEKVRMVLPFMFKLPKAAKE